MGVIGHFWGKQFAFVHYQRRPNLSPRICRAVADMRVFMVEVEIARGREMNRPRGKRVTPLTPGKVSKVTKAGRYADGGGLYLWVKPDGRKTWTFRWRDRLTGKLREAGLGSLTNERVTLKMARERADDYRDQVWRGIDPIAAKAQALQDAKDALANRLTFKDCMTRYIDAHKAAWRNEKHTTQWTNTLTTHAATLLPLPVADIHQEHVLECLEQIWYTKTETATRVRQRIEKVLGWAKAKKYRTGENPALWKDSLDKLLPNPTDLKEVKNRVALPYENIGEFMAKLRKRNSLSAKALELQILTATRPGEAVGAVWDEFDLKKKIWTIPAERMKSKKEHEIPLSENAVRLIKSLHKIDGSDYLFPGVKPGSHMTTAATLKAARTFGYTVKGEEIHSHGFRSTFRDWAGDMATIPSEVCEHALAHRLKDKAEAAYNRRTMFPKRIKLMKAWSDYCDQVQVDADNVTTIRAAK
ncbi:tyrosine-type recombinase/integrase [Pseudomonadota bacterium]